MMRVTFIFDNRTQPLNDLAAKLSTLFGARQILFEGAEESNAQPTETLTTEKDNG